LGYEWALADHFGMWQLIVGIAGFGLAIWQLWRTANATEAASSALSRRLLHNDLLVLMPELHRLEDDFDNALRSANRDLVANALVAYSRRVSAVVGHLKSDDALREENAVRLLTVAAKSASSAKGELYSRPSEDIQAVVAPAQRKMAAANSEVAELTARLQQIPQGKDSK
jgi:hypothetical protein